MHSFEWLRFKFAIFLCIALFSIVILLWSGLTKSISVVMLSFLIALKISFAKKYVENMHELWILSMAWTPCNSYFIHFWFSTQFSKCSHCNTSSRLPNFSWFQPNSAELIIKCFANFFLFANLIFQRDSHFLWFVCDSNESSEWEKYKKWDEYIEKILHWAIRCSFARENGHFLCCTVFVWVFRSINFLCFFFFVL